MNESTRVPTLVSFHFSDGDGHRNWTRLVLAGFAGAALLAVFGQPPIAIHGPNHAAGIMGPSCGMTRAVQYLARGQVGTALSYNPAVLLLAAFGAFGLTRAVHGFLTGRWLTVAVRSRRLLVGVGVGALILLWANQQLHADLLMGP